MKPESSGKPPVTYAIVNRKTNKAVCSGLTYDQAQAELEKYKEVYLDAEKLYMIIPQSH